ncbi:MAG TPA: hypothetical protein VFI28_02855 [Candidatus Limnocylindrales bacterium]|nr:hypothetical protein [Candidatus Limnocylindrales bacterium]
MSLTALDVALGVAALAYLLIPPRAGAPAAGVSPVQVVADASFLALTPILGAVLVRRRPDNVIGWLFISVAGWLALSFVTDGIARHVVPNDAVSRIAVIGSSLGMLGFVSLFLLFMVFPTGRLPSRRWRWLPVIAVVAGALTVVTSLLASQPSAGDVPDLPKPFGRPEWQPVVDTVSGVASILMVAALLATLVLLVRRFRASQGIERQQLKVFAWAASIVVGLLAIGIATAPLGVVADTFWTLALASLVLLPVAATVAILRYRLWDIDRLVSRTVAYAVVTAILVAIFGLVNLGLQEALANVTQAGTLAVAASTLAVFALFQPLRRRIQRLVDRRFDRARVDADRVAAAFADRLRGELDLESIGSETREAVERTLHPSFATIWLRNVE